MLMQRIDNQRKRAAGVDGLQGRAGTMTARTTSNSEAKSHCGVHLRRGTRPCRAVRGHAQRPTLPKHSHAESQELSGLESIAESGGSSKMVPRPTRLARVEHGSTSTASTSSM